MEIPQGETNQGNSGPVSGNTVWGFWSTTVLGLITVVASFVVEFLVIIIFMANYLVSNRRAGLNGALKAVDSNLGGLVAASAILEVVIGIPIIAGFVRLRRMPFREYIGLQPVKVKTMMGWLGLIIVYLVVTEGLRVAFKIPQSQNDVNWYNTSLSLPLFFTAVIIFAPVFEEFVFRGFMFRGYSQSGAGPVPAIILTAAMWAMLHVSAGFYDMAVIFGSGLILGFARWKTGSLWTPLSMHAFWNAVAFITLATSG